MTHWHGATLQVVPADRRVDSTLTPPLPDRGRAYAEMQRLLDRLAAEQPALGRLAELWRAGARQDWAYAGLLSVTIFVCRQVCAAGVQAFLDDYADELRRAGMRRVSVVQVPASW